ncbi:tRNA (guanine-N2-)-methyltransferase [Aureococcus anophagefferens]|nr:tRNA (guanine-N2-)-methyltransferase [Aureococcus anophagefferens]
MDAELAFIMARLANVREGDAVLDPFCGTGGCLLACAAYGGARGFGADCDARVLLRGTSHWDEASGRLPLRENDRLRHALASQLAKDGRREPRRGEVSDRVCSIAATSPTAACRRRAWSSATSRIWTSVSTTSATTSTTSAARRRPASSTRS